jgi:hypothetical protein
MSAAAFAEDAELLRGLRTDLPAVPRDLGARVSLALDDEVRRARRSRGSVDQGRPAPRRAFGRPGFAFAGLVAVAVVALLVVPLAGPFAAVPAGTPPAGSLLPAPTPIVVDSEPVAWVRRSPDGTYVLSSAEVRRVCAGADAAACGTLDGGAQTLATLAVKPSSVLLSNSGGAAVIVGQDNVYAVAVDRATPVTTPGPEPSPVQTSAPVQSPAASGEPTSPPVGSPSPSDSPVSPVPATPSTDPGPPTPLPTIPPATPAPSAAPAIAIAEGVVIVGAPPAYSADGQWVAFSARPADGSQGPDIYAWHVGELQARILTNDHGSVFSGWVNGAIVASTARVAVPAVPEASGEPSQVPSEVPSPAPSIEPTPGVSAAPDTSLDPALTPAPDPSLAASPALGALPGPVPAPDVDPATVVARSFLIAPEGAVVTEIEREGVWRPVVDPTDRVAVFWEGSLAWSETDRTWLPAHGQLVLADWQGVLGRPADPNATPDPNATATPESTPTPEASPAPDASSSPSATDVPPATSDQALPAGVVGTDIADWEVRFDPAGRLLGVWVADPAAPGSGRLALVTVESDASLGAVLLADAAALPGFSVGNDRLAWSTPPGRNGQGSLVTVFAWSGNGAGQLYGMPDPGQEPIVVVR